MIKRAPLGRYLFPAYAGVILDLPEGWEEEKPFPRLRGGDPGQGAQTGNAENFSPPMRG